MKRILSLSALFTVILSLVIGNLEAQDATASQILDQVSKTYKAYKSIKASFTINVKNEANNTVLKQQGTLYLKGKKFRIDMQDQEIYCDGKTMWTYFSSGNEVQISNYDPNAQEINPNEIFTIYEKGFDYRYTGESLLNGKKAQLIELTPKDKSKPYFKVKLNIDKASHKINNMVVMSKNGTRSEYSIGTFTGNLEINDNFFKFDQRSKPAVEVIDLR